MYDLNFDPPYYLSIWFDFRFEVAIKESQEQGTKLEMLDEAKAMIRVSKHDHIVNFQGICVANDSVYLLLEYCTLGSIDFYLRKHVREMNQKLRNQNFLVLMGWCIQIADGMEFLVKENVIHVSFHSVLERIWITGSYLSQWLPQGERRPLRSQNHDELKSSMVSPTLLNDFWKPKIFGHSDFFFALQYIKTLQKLSLEKIFFVPEKKIISLKKTLNKNFVSGTHRGRF